MSGGLLRFSSAIGCATLLLSLAGCAMVTDLINPGFLSTLGVDPATVIRPQGRVVIAFQNSTTYPAFMGALADVSVVSETEFVSDEVMSDFLWPNDTQTMVVDCPVGTVLPTGATLMPTASASDVITVVYEGSDFLYEGDDFFCGDVIEITVVENITAVDVTSGDVDVEYSIRVQILPGR